MMSNYYPPNYDPNYDPQSLYYSSSYYDDDENDTKKSLPRKLLFIASSFFTILLLVGIVSATIFVVLRNNDQSDHHNESASGQLSDSQSATSLPTDRLVSFTHFSCPHLDARDFTSAGLPSISYSAADSNEALCTYRSSSTDTMIEIRPIDNLTLNWERQSVRLTLNSDGATCTIDNIIINGHNAFYANAQIYGTPTKTELYIESQPGAQNIIKFTINYPQNTATFSSDQLIQLAKNIVPQ